jgi:hypothetical protein
MYAHVTDDISVDSVVCKEGKKEKHAGREERIEKEEEEEDDDDDDEEEEVLDADVFAVVDDDNGFKNVAHARLHTSSTFTHAIFTHTSVDSTNSMCVVGA